VPGDASSSAPSLDFQTGGISVSTETDGRPLAAAADTADDVQHQQQVEDVWNMSWTGQAGPGSYRVHCPDRPELDSHRLYSPSLSSVRH